MSVIIRLQNLPWAANAADIREFFKGLSIPEGGVHIVGGEMGDAFIAFSTDEDARLAMRKSGSALKGVQISLLLSSRAEMQKVIEAARQQALGISSYAPPAMAPNQSPSQNNYIANASQGHMHPMQSVMPPSDTMSVPDMSSPRTPHIPTQYMQQPVGISQKPSYHYTQLGVHGGVPGQIQIDDTAGRGARPGGGIVPNYQYGMHDPNMQPKAQFLDGSALPPLRSAQPQLLKSDAPPTQVVPHPPPAVNEEMKLAAPEKEKRMSSTQSKEKLDKESRGKERRRRSKSRSQSRSRDRRRRHRSRSRSRSREYSSRHRRYSRERDRDRAKDRTDREDRNRDKDREKERTRGSITREKNGRNSEEALPALNTTRVIKVPDAALPGLGEIPEDAGKGAINIIKEVTNQRIKSDTVITSDWPAGKNFANSSAQAAEVPQGDNRQSDIPHQSLTSGQASVSLPGRALLPTPSDSGLRSVDQSTQENNVFNKMSQGNEVQDIQGKPGLWNQNSNFVGPEGGTRWNARQAPQGSELDTPVRKERALGGTRWGEPMTASGDSTSDMKQGMINTVNIAEPMKRQHHIANTAQLSSSTPQPLWPSERSGYTFGPAIKNDEPRLEGNSIQFRDVLFARERGRGSPFVMRGRGRGGFLRGMDATSPFENAKMKDGTFRDGQDRGSWVKRDTSKFKCCVELLNVPDSATYTTVHDFFNGIYVPSNSIKIVVNSQGMRVGVAVVKFNDTWAAREALKRSGSFINNCRIQVNAIDEEVFEKAVDLKVGGSSIEDDKGRLESPMNINNDVQSSSLESDFPSHENRMASNDRVSKQDIITRGFSAVENTSIDKPNMLRGSNAPMMHERLPQRTNMNMMVGGNQMRGMGRGFPIEDSGNEMEYSYTENTNVTNVGDGQGFSMNEERQMSAKGFTVESIKDVGMKQGFQITKDESLAERSFLPGNDNDVREERGFPLEGSMGSRGRREFPLNERGMRGRGRYPGYERNSGFHRGNSGMAEMEYAIHDNRSFGPNQFSSSSRERPSRYEGGFMYGNMPVDHPGGNFRPGQNQRERPALEREITESSCLYVSELPVGCVDLDVAEYFRDFRVEDVVLELEKGSRQPSGGCFVKLISSREAFNALRRLRGTRIDNKLIRIHFCPLEAVEAAIKERDRIRKPRQNMKQEEAQSNEDNSKPGVETEESTETKETSSEPKGHDLLTDSVVLKGVPADATQATIRDFFSDEGLVPVHIFFNPPDPEGSCDVYASFSEIEHCKDALRKSEQCIGPAKITVELIAKPIVAAAMGIPFNPMELIKRGQLVSSPKPDGAVEKQESVQEPSVTEGTQRSISNKSPVPKTNTPETQDFRQRQPFGGCPNNKLGPASQSRGLLPHPTPPQIAPEQFGKPGCVVALKNVPLNATTDDILFFFKDYPGLLPENIIRRYNELNQPTSDARVALFTPQEAKRAVRMLDGKYMIHNAIHVSLC